MKILFLDGGGTKLSACLYEHQQVLFTTTHGACNLTLDYAAAAHNIKQAIHQMQTQSTFDVVLIAAAGVWSNPDLAAAIAKDCATTFKVCVKIISDIEYHYFKYFLKQDGYVINLGTGTSILSYQQQTPHLYYGYGPNFDEPGCGYDLGRKLLSFLAYAEVNHPQSGLYQQYLHDYQLSSIRSHVTVLNALSNTDMAKLAKWMLSLTSNSNLIKDIAMIVNQSLQPLLTWLSNKTNQPVYFIGGIVHNDLIQSSLIKVLKHAKFNAVSNYTVEEIWNMLLV